MASNSTLKNPAERLLLLTLPFLDAGVAVDTLSRDFDTDGNEIINDPALLCRDCAAFFER